MMAGEIMGIRRDRGIEQRAKVKTEGWKGRIDLCEGSMKRQNKLFLIFSWEIGRERNYRGQVSHEIKGGEGKDGGEQRELIEKKTLFS